MANRLDMGFVSILSSALMSVAHAQSLETGGWEIRAVGEASPSNPLVRVEVWAWFDDPSGRRDTFSSGDLDFIASDGTFRNPVVEIMAHNGASAPLGGTSPRVVVGPRIEDVVVGQLFGVGGFVGNSENPILVWSAQWGTHDFTPRTVNLLTDETSSFMIGQNGTHSSFLIDLYPDQFFHGSGSIRVVPAPAGAGLLLIGAGAMARRRRR